MSESWVILVFILISSLPLIAVFIWFNLAKYKFSIYRFLFALLAGAASIYLALYLQSIVELIMHRLPFQSGRTTVFFYHFVHIALTEELSRLIILLVFFLISNRFFLNTGQRINTKSPSIDFIKKASATGLIVGFGFALLENARYAADDPSVLLLRVLLAAPIHGACGSRIGVAAVTLRSNPFQAILRVLTAIAIHGVYNMTMNMPGYAQLAAILIAVSALSTAVISIKGGWSEDPTENLHETNPPNKTPLESAIDKNNENQ